MLKLHLGCGKRDIPGFTNVDICDLPHIHYRQNADDLSMFPDESVELIYASHLLEYFDRTEARDVLKEWWRVLMPGGTLRIAVPDFEALVRAYQLDGAIERILGPLFGRMAVPTPAGEQIIYQKTVYDLRSLSALLESAGFTHVRRYEWRDTIHKDFDDFSQAYLPHMDKEHGLLISLNLETVKPVAGTGTLA